MTSAADMTQHPDVSEISDLTEGLLTESRAAEVRSHTDTCDLCGDVLASLDEIRDLLGGLPLLSPCPRASPTVSMPRSPPRRCPAAHRPMRQPRFHVRRQMFHVKQSPSP